MQQQPRQLLLQSAVSAALAIGTANTKPTLEAIAASTTAVVTEAIAASTTAVVTVSHFWWISHWNSHHVS
jgi:hypothetical protein